MVFSFVLHRSKYNVSIIMGLNEELNRIKSIMFEELENKTEYFQDEMDELERAAQDLSRDGDYETSVKEILKVLKDSKETTLTDKIWSKLENTESNEIKKGEMDKVEELAKKYNKTSPKTLATAINKGDYRPPIILKFGNRYHLVAGNTRLCTAAALGINPKVIIGELG
jgi:predicted transcriptional regulator